MELASYGCEGSRRVCTPRDSRSWVGSALRGPSLAGEAFGRGDTWGGLGGRAGTRHVNGQQEDPGQWGVGATFKVGSTLHLLAPVKVRASVLSPGSAAHHG